MKACLIHVFFIRVQLGVSLPLSAQENYKPLSNKLNIAPQSANDKAAEPNAAADVAETALSSPLELVESKISRDELEIKPYYGPIKTFRPVILPTFTEKPYYFPIPTKLPGPFKPYEPPPVVYQPPRGYPRDIPAKQLSSDARYTVTEGELVAKDVYPDDYKYKLELKPVEVPVVDSNKIRPPPLPWKQQYKTPSYEGSGEDIGKKVLGDLDTVTKLLPNPKLGDYLTIHPTGPILEPIRPPPQPYKTYYGGRESEHSVEYPQYENPPVVKSPSELVTKVGDKVDLDKLGPTYTVIPRPIPSLKPVKLPLYDPAPIYKQLG